MGRRRAREQRQCRQTTVEHHAKGNQALRTSFTQLAQADARTKETYLSALYGRLAARRGKQHAIMAVAHSIAVSVFHMLTHQEPRITG